MNKKPQRTAPSLGSTISRNIAAATARAAAAEAANLKSFDVTYYRQGPDATTGKIKTSFALRTIIKAADAEEAKAKALAFVEGEPWADSDQVLVCMEVIR